MCHPRQHRLRYRRESADQHVLFRLALEPGAIIPIVPEQGTMALLEVERGVVIFTVDGPGPFGCPSAQPGAAPVIPVESSLSGERILRSSAQPTGDLRNEG